LKNFVLRFGGVLLCALFVVGSLSCKKGDKAGQPTFAGKNVRVVIGSTSTSGDSYLIAETVSRYLSKELNANFKVDPVGAARALETMQTSKPDGATIMLFHDMTYLGVSFKAYDDMYRIENMTIGPRAAQNPAGAWAAHKDAPFDKLADIPGYLQANSAAVLRFALEAGGTSHLNFIVFYDWVKLNYGSDIAGRLKVIVAGSAGDRIQMLIDRNADVIAGEYAAVVDYTRTDDKKIAMKVLCLFDDVEGIDIPSYADMGIDLADGTAFRFPKDFVFYFPKDFPQPLLDELEQGMANIARDPQFLADMEKITFRPAYMNAKETSAYIHERRDTLQKLIDNSPSLDDLVR
jgi:tripartite-type tricarboxylate transporter receptor subunit TctC